MRALLPCLLLLLGCSSRAGMFCQTTSDCRTGLLCRVPGTDAGAADLGRYGICVPALFGQGGVCLWSSECQPPFLCSNERGQYTGDGRHGVCVAPAAAPPDLAVTPADLSDAALVDDLRSTDSD